MRVIQQIEQPALVGVGFTGGGKSRSPNSDNISRSIVRFSA